MKGIKREFSVPRTPQQNGIAERKNKTLIEATRTMLADSLLPILFWAEAVNTACYVQNRVLVTKLQNKTPYELLHGRTQSIGFMRPFGCPVTILNTLDSLGKFHGKVDEGFLVGYSVSSRTRIVQETLHINFLENKPNVAEKAGEEIVQQYVLFPVWSFGFINPQNTDGDVAFDEKEPEFEGRKPESEVNVSPSSSPQSKKHDDKTKREAKGKSPVESLTRYKNLSAEFKDFSNNSINEDTAVELDDITYFDDKDDVGAEADFTNLETSIIEELLQFKMQKVCVLFDLPHGKRAIGHTQDEGIDYEEVFTPVARIEAIQLFLAYASFMGFMVYQMDVKSVFLYGTIEEEIYVCQPPGLEDPNYPDKRGKIDHTLFIKRQKGHILLVQIYVDDIIFGSTTKDLCKAFEKLMKDKFQMSSMGELTFFLGLQVKQKKDWIFISQDKYVDEILRKFGLTDGKSASTPKDTEKPLLKDPDGEDVDVHTYRSMIGSLMYLTSSRPDIMFAVCVCARLQVTPNISHLHAVKRIFRYLNGKPHLGLWYPKDSAFNLVAYSDSDFASASLDRKSTTGGCQLFGCRLISWQCKKQTVVATSSTGAKYVAVASCCAQVLWIQNQLLDYGMKSLKRMLHVTNILSIGQIKWSL
nr:retrovirus-related Pol polyprotein from transposon TNT 1-94 [Tanacetum cinerariifolium]